MDWSQQLASPTVTEKEYHICQPLLAAAVGDKVHGGWLLSGRPTELQAYDALHPVGTALAHSPSQVT